MNQLILTIQIEINMNHLSYRSAIIEYAFFLYYVKYSSNLKKTYKTLKVVKRGLPLNKNVITSVFNFIYLLSLFSK